MVGYRPILSQTTLDNIAAWFTNLDIVTLALPLLYVFAVLLLWVEHKYPARVMKKEKSWYVRAVFINALVFMVFLLVDSVWNATSDKGGLFTLSNEMSPFLGAMLGYFIFTFVVYWWHRLRHASSFVWRLFHQLHHSPKRIETLTAYYIHPLDMLANLTISNTIVFVLLGLDIEGAAWYVLITGMAGFLIHANINLPHWVGYVFQTPKMHRLHHKSGHHAQNYSDIVWWDMLFGTYANPKEEVEECGFNAEEEKDVFTMLKGQSLKLSKKTVHHGDYSFLDFNSYEALVKEEKTVTSFVQTYKEVFNDPELWAEAYSTQEIHVRLKAELLGVASLRLCVDNKGTVIAFAWVQELSIDEVVHSIESIDYYQEIGCPNVREVLEEKVAETKVLYLHDLGVKKDKRGEVSLRMLLCPMMQVLSTDTDTKEVLFWTIEKTKISILARYIGFKKMATVEGMQFFVGNLSTSKVGMICKEKGK